MLILIVILIIILLLLFFYYNKDNFYNSDKYDIVYSILAHENSEFLLKLINNIKKYNKNYKILILFHLNDELYDTFKPNIENVLINDIHYNKKTFHHSLTKAHLDNYNYLIKNNIDFKNIILLASNCMFIKQIKLNNKYNDTNDISKCEGDIDKLDKHHSGIFMNNKYWVDCFKRDNICIEQTQLEGSKYSKKLFGKISKYIEDNKFFDNIEQELQIEEILFVSLCKYYNSGIYDLYGKVFWNNPGYGATEFDIDNIRNDKENQICIVKRVPRDINAELIKYIDRLPEEFKNNFKYVLDNFIS
jgi:hypothetical protein